MFTSDAPISEFLPLSTHVSPTVLKTTGGDFMLVWRLEGLPFVGREEWELEHRHNTFNRMLQTLRAPDFVNVAFWVHDVRRRRKLVNTDSVHGFIDFEHSEGVDSAKESRKERKQQAALTLRSRVGETFHAVVSGVSAKATWIKLVPDNIEGRLVRGRRGLGPGSEVNVVLLSADPVRGFIDFAREDTVLPASDRGSTPE